jgi:RNA polymerase sigma-70 factor (ECF subfamily)
MEDMTPIRTPQPETAEADLLAGLRAGDETAFETMVRRHCARLLTAARRILKHEEDAREAVQDALLSAFRGIDRFDGACLLSTWLHRIVVNAALMKLRRRRRAAEFALDALLPRFLDDGHQADPPAPWPEPCDRLLERKEMRALIRASVDQLPESYRTVLMLRDIEELDTAETAQQLGVSEGVVKTRLHRARQALRSLLDPHVRGGEA